MEAELILEPDVEKIKQNATMALVFGILGTVVGMFSFVACPWAAWITLPLAITGIVKSIPALKEPEAQGMGTAGLILSIIGSVISGIGSIYAILATLYLAFVVIYLVVIVIFVGAMSLGAH